MTDGGGDGAFLWIGLAPWDEARLRAGLEASGLAAAVRSAWSVEEALADADPRSVLGVFLGAAGDWPAAAEALRRSLPDATRVALPGEAEAGDGWDDVLTREDLEPRVLARVFRSAATAARIRRRAGQEALLDPLTGVLNRRGAAQALARELAGRERGLGPVSALLVDCDDFKRVNDAFGLGAGDAVLVGVARAIQGAVRGQDSVARVGGDEFLVLLPQTRTWEAVEVADRVRTRVRGAVAAPDGRPLSVSIGVRRLDDGTTALDQVIGATQEGLRVSKSGGKDQVRVVDGAAARPVAGGDVEASLPPGEKLIDVRPVPVTSLRNGEVHSHRMTFATRGDEALSLAAQRAVQSAWDLFWVRAALEEAPTDGRPVLVRIYPATVLEVPPARLLGTLPKGLRTDRVVLSIDEQFLSGDPAPLRDRLLPLRDKGVRVSIDAADLSRAAVESLVLLRPETVCLDAGLCQGLAASRARKHALKRFLQVCEALQVLPVACGLGLPADREAAIELGIRLAVDGG